MKKYLNVEGFSDFLEKLEIDKQKKVFVETPEGDIENYDFLKMDFNGNEIILFDSTYGGTGIIQDSIGVVSREDFVEGAWQDIIYDGECKAYIEV